MRLSQIVRAAALHVPVVIDRDKTLEARRKYGLFKNSIIVARFDGSIPLYRIFDAEELKHILASGRITGGAYAIKAERDFGASWGSNINEVVSWGNGQRGKRLGERLYLAKMDGLDKTFAHLRPRSEEDADIFDPEGEPQQPVTINWAICSVGLGCSVINVTVEDVDHFYRVDETGRITSLSLSELKKEIVA